MSDNMSQLAESEVEDEKPQRVNKKSIEELAAKQSEGLDKTITIFYRPSPKQAMVPFIKKFSRGAATIFSKAMANQLGETGSYVVLEGTYMKPYKKIFDWINMCVSMGNNEKFPESNEDDNQALNDLIDNIIAADKLLIPEGSLNIFLRKRLFRVARKSLISLEKVRRIYDNFDNDYGIHDLRQIAVTSIFEAWWRKDLEKDEYEDYTYELSDLRDDISELDHDLHEAVENKVKFIEGQREKKKRERKEMNRNQKTISNGWADSSIDAADGQNSFANSGWDTGDTTATTGWADSNNVGAGWKKSFADGGWDAGDSAAVDGTFDYSADTNHDVDADTSSWNATSVATPTINAETTPTKGYEAIKAVQWESIGAESDVVGGRSWADEMNG